MVRAWFMDDSDHSADQRRPHQTNPPQMLSLEELKQKTGANYWKLDAENYEAEGKLAKIREELNLDYQDQVTCTPEKLPNYDQTLKKFFEEHIHSDDETRFIIDGSGYFDIREATTDKWIRIEVVKNDMISVPAGAYHRFTLDTKDYIVANRYFSGVPVWTPHNRPQEDHPARVAYKKDKGIKP